ncbi:MAG: S-layer protein domain-containing protein [Candidatus Methanoperedens sp.]|nr:S-layer protein domain-containing protein [Candidatus Methanoperedens sp.]MCZ7370268.1 S-layer protein domain-containing protein [Candidatus Methanoperedens sp.]
MRPVSDIVGASRTFSITLNQTVSVTWYINGNQVQSNEDVTEASYTNTSAAEGTWFIRAAAGNDNGTVSEEWTWIVITPQEKAPAITAFAPGESPVLDIEGASRSFNITYDQTVNVAWYINGIPVQSNEDVTSSSYTNASAVFGTWIVNATATNDNGTVSKEWTWVVKDITPPANVSNLTATGTGQTYINWTWENPPDIDFDGTRILIDGNFKTDLPRTSNDYSATGLAPGTSHSITVIAFDIAQNNATQPWPENMSTTLPNTIPGDNVIPLGLPSGVIAIFSRVTDQGNTVISTTQTSPLAPGFQPLGNYVDISTSANFTGNVTITLNYTTPPEGYNGSNVRLYHLNNAVWEDITENLDTDHNTVTGEATSLSLFVAGIYPPPKIDVIQEPPSLEITVKDSLSFNISVDQTTNVNWTVNGETSQGPFLVQAGGNSNFTFASATRGNYSIIVEASNTNGTDTRSWNVTVHPEFFFKGNRIWDGSKPDEFSLTYTWDPMSFSGFYYDVNDDVGDESITMSLNGYSDRTINTGKLVYTTSPQEVSFGYSGFGSFEVIGFMAEKYFAAYTSNSNPPNPTTGIGLKSVLAQGHLHRVLIDDDTRRTISLGGTLTLQDGYVLKAKDIDMSARTMLISLLKDGNEVDSTPLSAGQTYVYTKTVGGVTDLPLILVRFDSVFSGTEVQAAFLQGLFQISESYDTVNTGNDFGVMEVRSVSFNKIEMRNNADVSLDQGSTVDLMGDMKIAVADNSNAVRFALSVEKTGSFEVRSSIYREDAPIDEWTPYNFGLNIGKTSVGFYYDLDEGIGNESLRLAEPLDGSRTINDAGLVYTTTPEDVSFGYSGFGSYEVIGFMAEKYFAAYTASSNPPDPTTGIVAKSALSQGQLHKVLIDDDTKRTISVGGTLALQEGYVLKAKDIDMSARTMLISLLKDGNEVDSTPLSAGQTYVYVKRVGAVSDLPIIMARFDSVFSGTEVQAAFLQGLFQVSENYATINTGNEFGMMEVRSVSNDNIEMSNVGSIGLDNGANEVLMGNINLRVGDTTDNSLRFYFAVDVTPETVANQLVIDSPAQATAGDTVGIKVTAGGELIEGASLTIDSSEIGQTDSNGVLNYTFSRNMKGTYNLTGTKLGYQEDIKSINVLEYIERRLSIDAPATANQLDTIVIKVTSNSTVISNATVQYDNTTIGSTDGNGTLNYTLETSGTHAITASKNGYITVEKEIDVRAPFSQYEALDINITPNTVFTDDEAVIKSNITNAGTKKDTLPVELIVNGTAVDNRSVTLAPGEIEEVNFTLKEAVAANYTLEILGQKELFQVKERPFTSNLILIAAIATILGVIAIYLWTAKNKITLELIKRKLKFGKD